ncbi:hypothetical protein ACIQGZ_04945 [Streptomyces sp. NPDC092296]|uniref:hypothetical protein n=1 Tax=Streptomyces sp. NPDC092296 TaxID=3366012 RepID=UPI0038040DAD
MQGRQPGSPASSFAAPKPSRPVVKVLWALVPVVTFTLLAFAPATYLAARRRRPADWLGVAFFAVNTAAFCLGMVFAADPGQPYTSGDVIGITAMCIGFVVAPVHFLVMDRKAVWERFAAAQGFAGAPGFAAPPAAHPAQPGYGWPPQPPPTSYTPTLYQPQPQPGYAAPAPAPEDAARAELRQLGELLRRQAADGGNPDAWRDGGR